MLTHRAFEAVPPLKAALLVFGSIAIQGSALDWAVDHRTHHAFSDKEGDPHSPHHGFDRLHLGPSRASGTPTSAGCSSTTAPTASGTPRICSGRHGWSMFVDRSFPLWAVLTFAVPFALGG